MMKIKSEEQLRIKLKGDNQKLFKEVIKKLSESDKGIGFTKSPFSSDEKKFIDELHEKIK